MAAMLPMRSSNAFSCKKIVFIKILLKFIPNDPVDNKTSFGLVMAWHRELDNASIDDVSFCVAMIQQEQW